MDRDLSLSQTLGGLRIANPDDADTPPATSGEQSQQPGDGNDGSAAEIKQSQNSPLHLSSADADGSLGFDPSSYSSESFMTDASRVPSQVIAPSTSNSSEPAYSPTQANPVPAPQRSAAAVARQPSRTTSQRRSNRTSAVPPGYQPHPSAAAAAFAAMNSKPYPGNGRPNSTAYLSGPGPTGAGSRDAYRLHKESSQQSLGGPHRVKSTSRKAVMEAQAGVPDLETSHTERKYSSRPPVYTGAAVPRRKSSRGLLNVKSGQYPNPYGTSTSQQSESGPHSGEGGAMNSSEDWKEKGASIVGKHTEMVDGQSVTRYTRRGVKDFSFGKLLGEGSYSQVMLAKDRHDGHEYAVKILDKRHIIKEKKVKYVNIEKDTLNRLANHPGVVRLHYTFQDERSLYYVLDFASNGELLGVLKKLGTFDEDCTRFYASQLLETIEYMHSRGVIHRDLKPENILLDRSMHTKITDFGTAKMLTDPKRPRTNSAATNGQAPPGVEIAADDSGEQSDRARSFVGTAEYVSPELLTDKSACKASDLWAFGCIVYQLLAGRPPFKANSEYLTFQKIIKLDYKFPPGFPPAARDLIERCLVLDPKQRLTIDSIKNHDFFRTVNWGRGLWQQNAPKLRSYQPPAQPPIRLGDDPRASGADTRAVNGAENYAPDLHPSHSTRPVHISSSSPNSARPSTRPSPRVITELPPPSQLDIEWSPVLSKDNERILKLGTLLFLAGSSKDAPSGHRHGDQGANTDPAVKENTSGGGAFKRLFGGGGKEKKKTRMVMATTHGRLIIANGADDKKVKFEINLLGENSTWQQATDPKGLVYWHLETREKHFTFEDPKGNSSDVTSSTQMAHEWLEALDRSKEIAVSQSLGNSSYSSLMPTPSSKSPTLAMNYAESSNASANDLAGSRFASGGAGASGLIDQATNSTTRNQLTKSRDGKDMEGEEEEGRSGMARGFKRFSKRQSKSGLAAVF